MRALAQLPSTIGGIAVPGDRYPRRPGAGHSDRCRIPLAHSVRTYCWGVTIGAGRSRLRPVRPLGHPDARRRLTGSRPTDGASRSRAGDRTTIPPRRGVGADVAGTVATAIVLHMAPSVTLDDGVELPARPGDRSRRPGRGSTRGRRSPRRDARVPRGAFDRHFLAAIRREVAIRPAVRAATPARGRSGRQDGPLTMAGSRACPNGPPGLNAGFPEMTATRGDLHVTARWQGASRRGWTPRFEHEPVNGATDMNLYTPT